jgi:hypothetical protein
VEFVSRCPVSEDYSIDSDGDFILDCRMFVVCMVESITLVLESLSDPICSCFFTWGIINLLNVRPGIGIIKRFRVCKVSILVENRLPSLLAILRGCSFHSFQAFSSSRPEFGSSASESRASTRNLSRTITTVKGKAITIYRHEFYSIHHLVCFYLL